MELVDNISAQVDVITKNESIGLTDQNKENVNAETTLDIEGSKPKKKPRKILHFSDGSLEEYSTDEEDNDDTDNKTVAKQEIIDLKTLAWKPWLWYWMAHSGSSALTFCDYVGESLANFMGITSPKYQYEIDEYHRSIAEEEEEKKKEDLEMGGWADRNTIESKEPQLAPPDNSASRLANVISAKEKDDGFANISSLGPNITIDSPRDSSGDKY